MAPGPQVTKQMPGRPVACHGLRPSSPRAFIAATTTSMPLSRSASSTARIGLAGHAENPRHALDAQLIDQHLRGAARGNIGVSVMKIPVFRASMIARSVPCPTLKRRAYGYAHLPVSLIYCADILLISSVLGFAPSCCHRGGLNEPDRTISAGRRPATAPPSRQDWSTTCPMRTCARPNCEVCPSC